MFKHYLLKTYEDIVPKVAKMYRPKYLWGQDRAPWRTKVRQ